MLQIQFWGAVTFLRPLLVSQLSVSLTSVHDHFSGSNLYQFIKLGLFPEDLDIVKVIYNTLPIIQGLPTVTEG